MHCGSGDMIFNSTLITIKVNKFSTDIWLKLANKRLELHNKFEKYLCGNYASTPNESVSINQLKQALFFSETE